MSYVYKPFSKALYEEHDTSAKNAVVRLLVQHGHEIVKTEEDKGVDIKSTKNGKEYHSEAEIKTAWKGDWPDSWTEIRIPERKKRLLKGVDNTCLNFYILNNDATRAWLIVGSALTEDRLKVAHGRRIMQGERFFHIPVDEAILVIIPSLSSTG